MKRLLLLSLLLCLTASVARPASVFVHLDPAAVSSICAQGRLLGARQNVFAKVGDSITDERWFLYDFANPSQVNLGTNSYLLNTVNFYRTGQARTGTSYDNDSVAAISGGNTATLLSVDAALGYDFCVGQTPLICEYNVLHPSVSLIMIGTNNPVPDLAFEHDLGSIVSQTLDRGIVPVLYTIPPNWYKVVVPYNGRIRTVARAFNVPLVDYYAAMVNLPDSGLRADGVHPSTPPDGNTANLINIQHGYTLRNLLTLEALYQIYVICGS